MSEEKKDNVTTPKRRKVFKKQAFVCRGVDNDDPTKAGRFEVVAGPFKDLADAVKCIQKELPEGKYVIMYEGRTFTKKTIRVTKVTEQ